MTTPFPQQPDDSSGRRYSKSFKYVFVMLRLGDSAVDADQNFSQATVNSLVDDGRYVQLTLPQQISMREPFATAVTVMQDGGKVVETKGMVLKQASISGTTGFLPAPPVGLVPRGRLTADVSDLDGQLGAISGYLAFQKLRYLFRLYGAERRSGNLDVELHFYDYKNDDFWRIEPDSFDMTRSSRRPMSYDYNIAFKCLEPSDNVVFQGDELEKMLQPHKYAFGGSLAKIAGAWGAAPKQGILTTNARLLDQLNSGLAFLRHLDTVAQFAFQDALNKLNDVVGFFENVHDTFFTLLDLAPILLAQLDASLAGVVRVIDKFTPDNIAQELNAWYLECQRHVDSMSAQVNYLVGSQPQRDVKDTDQRFSQGRMRLGATTDLLQEPSGGSGAPDANPFIGASGLQLVTNVTELVNTTQYVTIVINAGEDIFALARRLLGDIQRAIDLILINRLEFPYIVSDAADKPANTLAWGERILYPAPRTTGTTISDGVDASVVPTTSGTVTDPSLPSELIDSAAAGWLTDQWVGYSCTAKTGGDRQTLVVVSNDADKLMLDGDWTITITPGVTTYTLQMVTFSPRRPVSAEERAYGRDLLMVPQRDGRFDLALSSSNDLALCTGLDNFVQAITLRARCPVGEHPFHRRYGLPAPVGRPYTADVGVLHVFFIRRSLLQDPRVKRVRNTQLNLSGDKLLLSAEVQPVDARVARPITVQVGS